MSRGAPSGVPDPVVRQDLVGGGVVGDGFVRGGVVGGGAGDGVVLVVTSVHPSDDPRVRLRHAGVLARRMPVRYAAPEPPPERTDDVEWVALRGGRIRRGLAAMRQMLRSDVLVVSVHDPELVPAALLARLAGRRVVVDVHEDVPAQILDKEWVPRPLRRPVAALAAGVLRAAERTCVITLAEDGYARRFRHDHPVFVNHPVADDLPPPRPAEDRPGVIYVGDVTRARGAELVVDAVAALPEPRPPLTLVGRCREPLRSSLVARAAEHGVDLHLTGFLPNPEAMALAAAAEVGVSPLLGEANHRESLPSKVIEYLAVGLPVVASDLPGTRRGVEGLDAVTLVPPGDAAAWSAAIAQARGDPALRARAAAQSAAVRRTHAWRADDLRALYGSLAVRA